MEMRESLIPALSVLAAAVLAAGAAVAAGGQRPAFANLDLNADGYIDSREAAVVPGLARQFTSLDLNRDGRLSRKEYDAYLKARRGQAPPPLGKGNG